MLIVENLAYGPRHLPPLREALSFRLGKGEMLHVKGQNGAGKSFLARTLLGLEAPRAGTISLRSSKARYLPQMQNRAAHLPYALSDILSFETRDSQSWVKYALLTEDQLSLAWNQASGGERQRTLLTRFFLQEGDFLVLDEPFNHLDSGSRQRVRALLRQLVEENPTISILLISHEDNPGSWMGKVKIQTLDLDQDQARVV